MKTPKANPDKRVTLRIVLIGPPPGVDFGVQEGKGTDYKTIQKQRSTGADISFEFEATVRGASNDGPPNFVGPFSQGPVNGRFLYVGVGTHAGQIDSPWSRRIKVPLAGITWDMIEKATANPKAFIEARLPGTGKDGGPSCATVRPIGGWQVRP